MSTTPKKGKVVKCVFSNEWQNPGGGTTYYYDLWLDNEETGSVGVNTKDSPRISEGAELEYVLAKGKFKIITSSNDAVAKEKKSSGGGNKGARKTYTKNLSQESFLGYTWGYAKDLIIAGKGMDDMEELDKVAEHIYAKIGRMLSGEDDAPF
jgi:hypothetical protein